MNFHTIDNLLNVSSPFAMIAAVLVWGWGAFAQMRRVDAQNDRERAKTTRSFLQAFVLFVAIIAFVILTSAWIAYEARQQLFTALDEPILSVEVDGRLLPEPEPFVDLLRHMNSSTYRYHHSHPTQPMNVVLHTKTKDIDLILARDSDLPNEYWVFDPTYKTTTQNDIGKVTTKLLDKL